MFEKINHDWPIGKNQLYELYFCILSRKNISRDSGDTRPSEVNVIKKGPAGSLQGPKWSMFLDRSLDNGQT